MDESNIAKDGVISIDERALDHIKDDARIQFQKTGKPELHKLLFTALFDFIKQQGGKPGFEVKL